MNHQPDHSLPETRPNGKEKAPMPEGLKYLCRQCRWSGTAEELAWDAVETCMGDDSVEMCPRCGSLDIAAASNLNGMQP